MSTHESVGIYTARPLIPRHEFQQDPSYRNIVGMVGGRALYLSVLAETHTAPTLETLTLTADMASELREFHEKVMPNDKTGYNYSCHTLAAMLQSKRLDVQDAQKAARELIENGEPTARLALGEQGVYGNRTDGRGFPMHSVTGLGRERNEVLQADGQGGDLSIVSYDANDKFFGTNLYKPR